PIAVRRFLRFVSLTLALVVSAARVAAAEAPARVALARPLQPDPLVAETAARIRGELLAAGFDVVDLSLDPSREVRTQVEAADFNPKAIATIAILPLANKPAVDVWVADRLTDKTLVRRLEMGKGREGEVTSALAI